MENFPQGESGKARDKAAEEMDADVSGRTLESQRPSRVDRCCDTLGRFVRIRTKRVATAFEGRPVL